MVSRFRVMVAVAVCVFTAACSTPAATDGPNPTSGGPTTAATAPAATPVPQGSTLPVATTTASVGAAGDPCVTLAQLQTALDALKALDPATATQADLQAAVHDVGQAGVTMIVQGAKAEDLRTLNIGAQLVGSMLDSPNATASEKTQAIAQFANTAQKVIDQMASTCG